MSLPQPSQPCGIKVARKGKTGIQTKQLGLQLLLKRIDTPSMTEAAKAEEIYKFFVKYQRILNPEIEQLSRV